MVKTSLGLVIGIGSIVALVQPDVFNAIVAFLLVGLVPGTSYTLPFWATILIAGAIAWLLIIILSKQSLLIGEVRRTPSTTISPAATASVRQTKRPSRHVKQSLLRRIQRSVTHRKRYRRAQPVSS